MATINIAAGSSSSTIQSAFTGSTAGDTITFAAGTYRITGKLAPKANQTITAFDQSGPLPKLYWSKDISGSTNGTWTGPTSGRWSKTVTGGVPGPDTFSLGGKFPVRYAQSEYLNQVTMNDAPLDKIGIIAGGATKTDTVGTAQTVSNVGVGECWINYDTDVVTIGSDPTGKQIEITGGLNGGFGAAVNNVEISFLDIGGSCDIGVDCGTSTGWNVHDCYVHAHKIGLHLATNGVYQNNRFFYNNHYGYNGSNFNGATFSGNEVAYNVPVSLEQNNGEPWASGAGKVTGTDLMVYGPNNNVHDNQNAGAWFDISNERLNLHHSTFFNNDNANVWYEISYGQVSLGDANHGQQTHMTDCVFTGGSARNILISTSRNVEIARCTLRGATSYQIELRDASRTGSSGGLGHRGIWNSVHDNDIWLDQGKVGMVTEQIADLLGYTSNEWFANTYHLPSPEGTHFQWQSSTNGTGTASTPMNSTSWRQRGNDPSPPAVYTDLTPQPPPPTVPQLTVPFSTVAGTATSVTFRMPTSTVIGQMMQISAIVSNGTESFTTPAGWNVAVASTGTGTANGTAGAVWYKSCVAGDLGADVTVALAGATARKINGVWIAIADSVNATLDSTPPAPVLSPDSPTQLSSTTPAETEVGTSGVLVATIGEKSATLDTVGPTFTKPSDVSLGDHIESSAASGLNLGLGVYTKTPIAATEAAKTFSTATQDGRWWGATVMYRYSSTNAQVNVSAAQQQRATALRQPRRVFSISSLLAVAAPLAPRVVALKTVAASLAQTATVRSVSPQRLTAAAAQTAKLAKRVPKTILLAYGGGTGLTTSPTLETSPALTTSGGGGAVATVAWSTQAVTLRAAAAALAPAGQFAVRLQRSLTVSASAVAQRGQLFSTLVAATQASATQVASLLVKLAFTDSIAVASGRVASVVNRVVPVTQTTISAVSSSRPFRLAASQTATATIKHLHLPVLRATQTAAAVFSWFRINFSRMVGFGQAIVEPVDLFAGVDQAQGAPGEGVSLVEALPSEDVAVAVGGGPSIADE